MIEINNLDKRFDDKILFNNFNMQINDGDFVVFTGESGCGKTTLLNMIGAIEPIDSGNIVVDGNDVSNKKYRQEYLKTKVGFLFQNFALIETKTVKQNLDLVKNNSRTSVTIEQALNFVELPTEILQRKVYSLSGGEQQRIAIARLLLKKCDIILADEPTGSLDRKNADRILNLICELNGTGKTIILVTHDALMAKAGKRVIEIG